MPNSKNDKLRKIDIRPPVKGGGSLITSAVTVAPPARGQIGIPLNLRLIDTTIARSTQASMALVNIEWDTPTNFNPDYYEIEYGKETDWTGSGFGNPLRVRAYNTSAALLADADTDYRIRVRAQYRTTVSPYTATLSVHTAEDNVAPPDFDTYSAEFQNGNLVVTYEYAGITPENFKEARIQIYNADKSILYADIRNGGRQYVWTEAANIKATLGIGVTDVSVDITPVSWTETQGTTVNDTAVSIAPDVVTFLAYDFSTGDLNLNWVNPTNAPFKLITVKIYDDDTLASLYRTIDVVGNNAVWSVNDNFNDTGNDPDPNVHVTVQVVGWLNQASTVVDVNAIKTPPLAPATVNTSWDSDAGTADETIIIGWTGVPYVRDYEITINSKVLYVTDNSYTYNYGENVADHAAPGDPTLTVSVKARDRLLQLSTTPTINNAINAAPNIALAGIAYQVGFSSVGTIITLSSTIHDFKSILWEVLDDTLSPIQVLENNDFVAVFIDLAEGEYSIQARIRDLYDQLSDPIDTGTFTVDALTLEELRQGLEYTDSVGNTAATLSVLKDGLTGVLDPNVLYTNGTYPSYMWTQAEWPLLERIRTITFLLEDNTSTPSFYIATSPDGLIWTYFAGPVTDTRVLTEKANQAAAETAQVLHSDVGTRVDLPEIVEARFVRVYHRATSAFGNYLMYEFFPRRLVQTDDLEVEAVKAINIAAGAVTADKITVTTLSSVQSSTGTLVINAGGHLRSGMTAWNTGTGYYFDNNGGTPRFMIGVGGGTRFYWDGSALALEGSNFILRTGTSLPYTQLDNTGIAVIGTLGQFLFRVDGSTGKVTFGDWVAQTGEPSGTEGALSFGSGSGGAAGTTQQIQIYNSASASPTASNILSYWHNNRVPASFPTGINTGPRTEFVGTNGDIGSSANTILAAIVTTGTNNAYVYLRAAGATNATLVRLADDGNISITRAATTRNAITDLNDGFLRINGSSHYASGIYTPGDFRMDGSFLMGAGRLALLDIGDGYLRFNNSSHYTNGIYTPGRVRIDGTVILGVGTANNNVRTRIISTGNSAGHYPILTYDATDTNVLFYVQSASATTATGVLAAASWTYTSDEKLKEDITDIPSQKDKIKLLKPKRFRYKGEDKYSLGFTAQDFQQVFPEIVEEITIGEETILGIRSSELLPIIIKELIDLRVDFENEKKK